MMSMRQRAPCAARTISPHSAPISVRGSFIRLGCLHLEPASKQAVVGTGSACTALLFVTDTQTAMFGQLGPMELLIIFLIVLVMFGAKRIPEIARGLGKGIREFKSATTEITRELTIEDKKPPVFQPPPQQPIHTQQHAAPHQQSAVPPVGSSPPIRPSDQP